MITWLDFETTFIVDDRKRKDPSPYIANNKLVSVGWDNELSGPQYRFFYHTTVKDIPEAANHAQLQAILDKTTLLVAHNAKFELQWLKAAGFKYDGAVACTMIRQYVLNKGLKLGVGLKDCCIKADVANKKSDLIDDYLKHNIGFEVIPVDIVEEYGLGDVQSCKELYHWQLDQLDAQKHLWPTVELMEEFCQCLADIEDNGIQIDIIELDRLELEYTKELNDIKIELQDIIKEVMGATPVSLDSPEQLSQVLHSRKVTDKNKWKDIFNLGTEKRGSVNKPKRKTRMSPREFAENVIRYTEPIYRTTASQCPNCLGTGKAFKRRKNGENFKRENSCLLCSGYGILYTRAKEIAGFKFIPRSYEETAVGGFITGSDHLEKLKEKASGSARTFLEKLSRANSISTYLSSFVGGIRRGLRDHDILHPSFMQCVTATGRLSSRNPNFQNQPRGNTFPVRKCIVSRFLDGTILSGDAKQLEFRVAGELSNDKQIFEDVLSGLDVHNATATWTKLSRQESKPFTFAPVYGATDKGKPDHIAAYFRYFQDRYKGLFSAHKEWQNTVLETGSYILPSGREFIYPGTTRYNNGSVSNSTVIANYPVQAFATADLMPIYCINLWRAMKVHKVKSLIILEVHDDVTVDVYPGELDIIKKLMVQAFNDIYSECERRYGYKINMLLEVELKAGPNWLQQKEIPNE